MSHSTIIVRILIGEASHSPSNIGTTTKKIVFVEKQFAFRFFDQLCAVADCFFAKTIFFVKKLIVLSQSRCFLSFTELRPP
jgi:hypothetical protein